MKSDFIPLLAALALLSGNAQAEGLRAHEWGTFTTLHAPSGIRLPWYQAHSRAGDLPAFVRSTYLAAAKYALREKARMETPVIYFYTDAAQKVDVDVTYPGGVFTEFFPGTAGFQFSGWKQVELLPPDRNKIELPSDPELPESHYFQARAVPEAAIVRQGDQVEKFLFYRGAGDFETGLRINMNKPGVTVEIENYDPKHQITHSWILSSSATEMRWKKLEVLPKFRSAKESKTQSIHLNRLNAHGTREQSITALTESMVAALSSEGLTPAEAIAMVATWDEQWYEEPGQRVFTIVPKAMIESALPLKITPEPSETVRVFVHRAEILSRDTVNRLELAMAPGTSWEEAHTAIQKEQLGRFVQGALDATAEGIARKIASSYRLRGMLALREEKPEDYDSITQ